MWIYNKVLVQLANYEKTINLTPPPMRIHLGGQVDFQIMNNILKFYDRKQIFLNFKLYLKNNLICSVIK